MSGNPCHATRRAAWIGCVVLLTACSTAPRRSPDAAEPIAATWPADAAVTDTAWSLRGRIAVADGNDGGSGRIEWHQHVDRFRIEIRAPVSRRTWRLAGAPGDVVLEGLEGGARRGDDAETLLQGEVGWTVPFESMIAWVRGAPATGAVDVTYDAQRRPQRLEQAGWLVEYRAWDDSEPALPRKIFASRGERRVRLIVERWSRGDARD
jgi:outer membrane lipoprotein LolB